MKRIFTLITALLFTTGLLAQPHMSATIQNMHLWRGGLVADGIVLTTDAHYAMVGESLKIGFWGGTNSVGEYKEFNYYASYQLGNFTFALSDTYNFSTYATYNNQEFFNYSPSHTGRFLDASIKYRIGDESPLVLTWATVVFGRDRDASNSANRYSTFCSAEYQIYKKGNWIVDIGLGEAFALRDLDNSANFFGEKSGIVEATMKVSNKVVVGKYEIPVHMEMMWNPQSDAAYMQFCAEVVRF